MMTPGRLLKQPLVMQFKSKKSKITDYDVNRYYYPIATVYKNLGLGRTGNPYDDPQDKAKKDTENTAICFTRTDFDKWENDLWRDLRLLVSRIYISNQEGEKLETKLVQHSPEANFATPYSSSDSGVSYGGRKIIVLPKNLMYRFSFSLPKEEIKKFKSFKVGIQ